MTKDRERRPADAGEVAAALAAMATPQMVLGEAPRAATTIPFGWSAQQVVSVVIAASELRDTPVGDTVPGVTATPSATVIDDRPALARLRGKLSSLGAANSQITARAGQLRRRLRGAGYQLHGNLLEVSPTATVAALCGPRVARGYKRDADPWVTRAVVLERFSDLSFAPQSRMAREDVLRNDHCFDAVISAYTAYLWARDGWELPTGIFEDHP